MLTHILSAKGWALCGAGPVSWWREPAAWVLGADAGARARGTCSECCNAFDRGRLDAGLVLTWKENEGSHQAQEPLIGHLEILLYWNRALGAWTGSIAIHRRLIYERTYMAIDGVIVDLEAAKLQVVGTAIALVVNLRNALGLP